MKLKNIIIETKGLKRIVFMVATPETRWAILAAVIGLLSLIINIMIIFSSDLSMLLGLTNLFFTEALATTTAVSPNPPFYGLKENLVGGMLISLSFLFFWALGVLTFSESEKAVNVAQDAVKTLSGFFIGSITGLLGG